ncbi:MAG: hypothetical protein K6E13_07895 [Lachnospiraceae bacterium]|nr:hypothetical protein [Lachnospiraceae bacterium]
MFNKNEKMENKVEFNDAAYAKSIRDEALVKMEKVKKGLMISGIASLLSVVGLIIMNVADAHNTSAHGYAYILFMIAICGAMVSYVIGGGFGLALKGAFSLAKVGFWIIPIPFLDLATGLITIVFALFAFLLFPVLCVFISYRQIKNDYEEAEKYLQFYQPVSGMRA